MTEYEIEVIEKDTGYIVKHPYYENKTFETRTEVVNYITGKTIAGFTLRWHSAFHEIERTEVPCELFFAFIEHEYYLIDKYNNAKKQYASVSKEVAKYIRTYNNFMINKVEE